MSHAPTSAGSGMQAFEVTPPPPPAPLSLRSSLWLWPALAIVAVALAGQWLGPVVALVVLGESVAIAFLVVGRLLERPGRLGVSLLALATAGSLVVVLSIQLRWTPTTETPRNGPVDLRGKDVDQTTVDRLDLRGGSLAGAKLDGLNLHKQDLTGVSAAGASLRGVHLDGVSLRGADLRGADLTAACLHGVNLTGAILTAANVDGADLSEAVLSGGADQQWLGAPAPAGRPPTGCLSRPS